MNQKLFSTFLRMEFDQTKFYQYRLDTSDVGSDLKRTGSLVPTIVS